MLPPADLVFYRANNKDGASPYRVLREESTTGPSDSRWKERPCPPTSFAKARQSPTVRKPPQRWKRQSIGVPQDIAQLRGTSSSRFVQPDRPK